MSKILNSAIEHYSSTLDTQKVIEVPEWGTDDKPLKIYVTPANLKIRDQIIQSMANAPDGSLKWFVDSIIIRSMGEDGFPLFTSKDKSTLMTKVDPDVLQRIAFEVNDDLLNMQNDVDVKVKN